MEAEANTPTSSQSKINPPRIYPVYLCGSDVPTLNPARVKQIQRQIEMKEEATNTPAISQKKELVKNTIHQIAEIEDKISTHHGKIKQIQVQIIATEDCKVPIADKYLALGLTCIEDLWAAINAKLAAIVDLEDQCKEMKEKLANYKSQLDYLETEQLVIDFKANESWYKLVHTYMKRTNKDIIY